MPFKDLEHDGFELFQPEAAPNKYKARSDALRKQISEEKQAELKRLAQELYMQPDNPALWIGDDDT